MAEDDATQSTFSTHDTLTLGGETPVLGVWGGIGFTRRPLRDLRDLSLLYQAELADFLAHCDRVLAALSSQHGSTGLPPHLLSGLASEAGKKKKKLPVLPDEATMVVTAVLQVACYVVLCARLRKTPGELARCFTAFAGHSVGLTAAVSVAMADSWSSLLDLTELLVRGHWHTQRQVMASWGHRAAVADSTATAAADSVRQGHGVPSPMLSVTGLPRRTVEQEMDAVNRGLAPEDILYVALINEADSLVAAGSPDGLVALCARLRMASGGPGSDAGHANLLGHGGVVSLHFLPATAPFHSPHLAATAEAVKETLEYGNVRRDRLLVPVWGLDELLDTGDASEGHLGPGLSALILSRQVDWPKVMERLSGGPWQVLDFGPGGLNGIGSVLHRMRAGSGSKMYAVCPVASWLRGAPGNTSQPKLLATISTAIHAPVGYAHARFAPRRPSAADARVAGPTPPSCRSRFTDLLGLPPVLVAGMTPTTCDVDLVAAAMSAGFYAELATGGYHDAASLAAAVRRLAQAIPPGRLITANVIYASPQTLGWIIPQLAALVREGCPLGGLTVGAGVPDPRVAAEYIETLELSYIGFKPASAEAIRRVLEIARAHAAVPVILQWTGGRAGGHHSTEDFHDAILETYAAVRELPNVVLVAGSGFGDGVTARPYITGEWSRRFAREPMPFDAVLVGTCVMTTREAKTSRAAKQAMVDAAGVADADWTRTMRPGAFGGGDAVISVVSQLGEPMHVVATRGMRLWAELDATVFCLPRDRMLARLTSRREHIIARLNADYQKVWFGVDPVTGEPRDVADMTYVAVLRRLMELLHPACKGDWIHPTYRRMFDDWLTRTLERFRGARPAGSPNEQVDAIAVGLPGAARHLLSAEDAQYFLDLCGRRGQRAPPFIAALDETFPVLFKKDALWQSEDVESTHHGDVGRVCILCGPVAVAHCRQVDVPVGTLLKGIYRALVDEEPAEAAAGWCRGFPLYEEHELIQAMDGSHLVLHGGGDDGALQLADGIDAAAVDRERWLLLIGSRLRRWGARLFGTRKLVSQGRARDNPVRRIFAARPGILVRFADGGNAATLYGSAAPDALPEARVSLEAEHVTVVVTVRCTLDRRPRELVMKLRCDEARPYAPLTEVGDESARSMDMADLYRGILLGDDDGGRRPSERRVHVMRHDAVTVTRQDVLTWMRTVDGQGLDPDAIKHLGPGGEVPLEYVTIPAMVGSWRHLLTWDWDVSRLLHRYTSVELAEGQRTLRLGDRVTPVSRLRSLLNRDAGLDVGVRFTFARDDGAVFATVAYDFTVLGQSVRPDECFERGEPTTWTMGLRTAADVEAVLAKRWFRPRPGATTRPRVGQTLAWVLRRDVSWRPGVGYTASTSGQAWVVVDGDDAGWRSSPPYGSVEHHVVLGSSSSSSSNKNRADVVADFMRRAAVAVESDPSARLPADKRPRGMARRLPALTAVDNSVDYARSSGDYNPIHTTPALARLTGLHGLIWHGNHTAAAVLQLIRREVPEASSLTLRRYDCAFPATVSPGDELSVSVRQVGTRGGGGAVLAFSVRRQQAGDVVLHGEVGLAAPRTAFLFTGQGSQFAGMGLDLMRKAAAAAQVWAEADAYFENHWGFSMSDIVRRNPTDLTVHFGARQGARVRQNYLDMQARLQHGVWDGLDALSPSYTMRHQDGLLSATQFAQPALLVVEKAALAHLRRLGRVPADARFAGHSLGEVAAIGCMTDALPLEAALEVVFVRGALMQAAVARDREGRSGFAMVAMDPARIHKDCRPEHVLSLVETIARRTQLLLEVVNFNVQSRQYVCAGSKTCLCILQRAVDDMHGAGPLAWAAAGWQGRLVSRHMTALDAIAAEDLVLARGRATVPLKGIDVPFHSSLLAPLRPLFRSTLERHVARDRVRPDALVGRWVPNVTGTVFALDHDYVRLVARRTGSARLEALVAALASRDRDMARGS